MSLTGEPVCFVAAMASRLPDRQGGVIIKGEGHWLPGRITGQYWLFQILAQFRWTSLSADGLEAGYG